MADGCIFCAIATGEAPARRVYEDDRTLAFLDIFPVTPGHTLIIPKQHCDNVVDCLWHGKPTIYKPDLPD